MTATPAMVEPFVQHSTIWSASYTSIGLELRTIGNVISAPASAAYPTANIAIFVPFVVYGRPVTVVQLGWVNGATTVTGNADVGVYNASGTRLISTGSTARSGLSVMQRVDVTDTVLQPGLYYLAVVGSDLSNWQRWSVTAPLATAMGVLTQASALPLPATATFAVTNTLAFIPIAFIQTGATM